MKKLWIVESRNALPGKKVTWKFESEHLADYDAFARVELFEKRIAMDLMPWDASPAHLQGKDVRHYQFRVVEFVRPRNIKRKLLKRK